MRPSVRRPTKPSRTTPTRSRRARGRRPIAISSPVVSTWEMRSSVTSDGVGGAPAQPQAAGSARLPRSPILRRMALAPLQDVADAPASFASNRGVKALADVAVRGAQLALLIAAARVWGPERFGVFAFAGSFATIVVATADFGLQLQLARGIAQGGGRRSLRAVVTAKLFLSTLTLFGLIAASLLYP